MVLVQFPECDVEVMRTPFLPGHELNSIREGDAWESVFPSIIGRTLYWKETDLFPCGQDKPRVCSPSEGHHTSQPLKNSALCPKRKRKEARKPSLQGLLLTQTSLLSQAWEARRERILW